MAKVYIKDAREIWVSRDGDIRLRFDSVFDFVVLFGVFGVDEDGVIEVDFDSVIGGPYDECGDLRDFWAEHADEFERVNLGDFEAKSLAVALKMFA